MELHAHHRMRDVRDRHDLAVLRAGSDPQIGRQVLR
jgi:hypothetical protein